ncbi:hypothetical protein [Riemerella columbina]|uniref:hypothetical protein n=1 Tax=Riemerella columbina TaxID=103810 RepID=UPI000372A439|nr:hypothetical protein [Riemerella columbina]
MLKDNENIEALMKKNCTSNKNLTLLKYEIIEDLFDSTESFEKQILDKIDENEDSLMSEFKKFYFLAKKNNWEKPTYKFKYF